MQINENMINKKFFFIEQQPQKQTLFRANAITPSFSPSVNFREVES